MDDMRIGSVVMERRMAEEHVRIDALIREAIDLVASGAIEAARERWTTVESELNAHLDGEEREFDQLVPALSAPDVRGLASEHRYFRTRVRELRIGLEQGRLGGAALRAFNSELRAHTQREAALLRSRSMDEDAGSH